MMQSQKQKERKRKEEKDKKNNTEDWQKLFEMKKLRRHDWVIMNNYT